MIRFSPIVAVVALAGLMLAVVPSTQAAFSTGTQGVSDSGNPTISGGGTLSTASSFNFGDLTTTSASTGSFLTTPSSKIDLGAAILTLATPSTFTFGNAAFGTFVANSIMTTFSSDQARVFMVLGTFAPGTNFGGGPTSAASFNLTFNANSSSTGISYSDSGTLSVATVPEPASVVLLGLGLAGAAGFAARRHRLSK